MAIDPRIHRRSKWRNRLNTALIIMGLTLLLVISAWALFGKGGILWAIALGVGMTVATPRFSPKMVLRLYKARAIHPSQAPELSRIIQILARRAELPSVPTLFYVASSNMNAFAVGRPEESAITVTDGLLRGLNLRQIAGVLAHEISHIANEDLKVMGLADVVSRLTGLMQSLGFFLLLFGLWQGGSAILAALVLMLAPTVGTLLQLALSRSREYDADLGAARLTGDPAGLASALRVLQRKQGGIWESLFIPGGRIPDPSLLRTHPNTNDRVRRLLELTPEQYPHLERPPETIVTFPGKAVPVHYPPHYRISGLWY